MSKRNSCVMQSFPVLAALSCVFAAVATFAAPAGERRVVVADAGGMAAYVHKGDASGAGRCHAGCAKAKATVKAKPAATGLQSAPDYAF